MHQTFITIAAFLAASASAATCQLSAYSCLTSNTAASAYCSSALGAAQAVVTSVDVVQKTTTLSNVPTSTVTVFSTKSIVSRSTVTTFTSASTTKAARKRRRAAPCDSAENILSDLDRTQLSEACSCIGALPSAEAALLRAAPSTKVITGEVWFTVAPEVTVSTVRTVSTRAVETVKLAAPTSFPLIWGPKAGCDNVGRSAFESFVYGDLTEEEVTEHCKGACRDRANCAFLYVQAYFQFYNCYYNNHTFNENADLECGKDTAEWGSAKGYDVIGRGKA